MIRDWLRYRKRIGRDPQIMSGEPCIDGTRMPTWTVHQWGSYEAFAEQYPPVYEREAVEAALWYESLPHRRFGRWWAEHGWTLVRNRDLDW